MGGKCFKPQIAEKDDRQRAKPAKSNEKPACNDEIQINQDRQQVRNIPEKKPVILFYGFEGPFQCEVVTKTPQLFTCFPKPNCQRAIKWSGEIKDNKLHVGKHSYPYLFWESPSLQQSGLKPHFRINREDMSERIFDLLISLGLSEEQSTNFVTFWIHEWTQESSWLIHVVAEQVINKLYPLKITPKPFEVKRFYLLFGKDIDDLPLQPLQMTKWEMTNNKTVVEWGATNYNFA